MEDRTNFRNAPTIVVHLHKFLLQRAREMNRERSRGQSGTIESGSIEPRELDAPAVERAVSEII
jgi:hypothetical protein